MVCIHPHIVAVLFSMAMQEQELDKLTREANSVLRRDVIRAEQNSDRKYVSPFKRDE